MLLFGLYLILIVIGMREWRRSLRCRPMQSPEIERLCRAVVPGSGTIDIQALGCGLINETYRITRDGAATP